MTTASDHAPYWQALRFYSRPWRERHGTDMVAMMLTRTTTAKTR